MTANPYIIGEAVVTQRGKRGTVVALSGDFCDVRFGGASGPTYPVRWSRLVSERAYDRMNAPRQRQMYQ